MFNTKKPTAPDYPIAQQFIEFNRNATPLIKGSALDEFNRSIVTRCTRVIHDWSARYAYTLDASQQTLLHQHHEYLDKLSSRPDFSLPADMEVIKHSNPTSITHAQALSLLDQSARILILLGDRATDEDRHQQEQLGSLAHQIRRSMYHEMATHDPAYFTAVVDISNLNHGASSEPFSTAVSALTLANTGYSIKAHDKDYQIRIQPVSHGNVQYDIMATMLRSDPETDAPASASHLINVHGALNLHGELQDSNSGTYTYTPELWDAFNLASTEFTERQQLKSSLPYASSTEEKAAPVTTEVADTLWQNPLDARQAGSPLTPTPPSNHPPADTYRVDDERRPRMI